MEGIKGEIFGRYWFQAMVHKHYSDQEWSRHHDQQDP
jgi:hypothetical protein